MKKLGFKENFNKAAEISPSFARPLVNYFFGVSR
jgi:hypothetical protein